MVDLPADRPVVTICAADRTSLIAAEQLRARGLETLSLEGGMRAWRPGLGQRRVALVMYETLPARRVPV